MLELIWRLMLPHWGAVGPDPGCVGNALRLSGVVGRIEEGRQGPQRHRGRYQYFGLARSVDCIQLALLSLLRSTHRRTLPKKREDKELKETE